jgi:hypothetical protein
MKSQFLLTAVCTGLLFGAAASSLRAQEATQVAYAPEAEAAAAAKAAKAAKAAPKKLHKVWTEDSVSSLRTPADDYLDQKQAEAEAAAAKQEKSPKPQAPASAPPALSNPKSTKDADRMIAWEERDLAAQQEHVDNLRSQLQEAPAEDRDRLQKLLVQRMQIVEQVKKERDDLLTQKKSLEKKVAADQNSSADTPAPPAQ